MIVDMASGRLRPQLSEVRLEQKTILR